MTRMRLIFICLLAHAFVCSVHSGEEPEPSADYEKAKKACAGLSEYFLLKKNPFYDLAPNDVGKMKKQHETWLNEISTAHKEALSEIGVDE